MSEGQTHELRREEETCFHFARREGTTVRCYGKGGQLCSVGPVTQQSASGCHLSGQVVHTHAQKTICPLAGYPHLEYLE